MEQVKKMYRISRSIRKELGFFVKKFEQYSLSFSLCISNKMVQFVECKKLYILLVLTERSLFSFLDEAMHLLYINIDIYKFS